MEIKKTILIIDDDMLLSESLQVLLESDGHEVMRCDDGLTAIELTKERSFEIIISDYNMPGMDGANVVSRLRRQFAHSFIIGYSGEMKEKDFLESGADVFLRKPFNYPELLSLIGRIPGKNKVSVEKD